MYGITNRTIILLGGNVVVAASANLASAASMTGTALLRVGAAAALSSDYGLTASPTQGHFARANLSGGAITAGVGTSFRLAAAALSFSGDLEATGDGTFNVSATPMPLTVDLQAAGGVQFDATAAPMSAEANMLVVNPGVLFDGGSVVWALSTNLSTTVSPVFRLILPTRKNTFTRHRLFGRYAIDTGVAMLIKDGAVTFSEAPSDNELKDSDLYFLGGYRHQITPAQRAVIVSAGYGDLVEEG
jgi:hypothetical protein